MITTPVVDNETSRGLNWPSLWRSFYQAALAVVLSLFIGGLLLWVSGRNPLAAYQNMLHGAFGTTDRLAETLVKMTPLLLIAVSVSLSFRCRVWNIGAEGQFLLGAIASTWLALTLANLPPIVVWPLTFLGGAIGGAVWGGLAGVLKAYTNANEIITTSMLNYIAIHLLTYLVNGPMQDKDAFAFPRSPLIADRLELPKLIAGTRLHIAFIAAVVIATGTIIFWRSTLGLRTEIVGASRRVARQIGLNVGRTFILITVLSGALAGLAGWGEILGLHFRLIEEISRGLGTMGVVAALVGELHPVGVIISTFLFAALAVGGNAMERNAGVPFALIDVIQGCVILLVLSRAYFIRGTS
jgi:ABC-type uncharacterized transport system permease subunit